MPHRYFAYGSNMNPDRVSERGLQVTQAQGAWAPNLALRFNKADATHRGEGHANLIHAPGEFVEGVLYTLASEHEILKMDPFERTPINYSREALHVYALEDAASPKRPVPDSAALVTWTYFANPAVIKEGLQPSRNYLNHLLGGKPYLSPQYFAQLLQQPTATE